VVPAGWGSGPRLLAAARAANDDELVGLPASRYATQVGFNLISLQLATVKIADELASEYQAVRDRDEPQFARRAANVLTQIPAFAIANMNQLLQTNALARLLFVRSFSSFLTVPAAVRDLVEGSDVHVQMLGYRVLAQDDVRAQKIAADSLEILLGTLMRPLHRKTRLAAFGALANAARADSAAAAHVLRRAREALRLPDKKYPKEQLAGLIGRILHERPELRGPRERPRADGLLQQEAAS
jgi:hypothetical protein